MSDTKRKSKSNATRRLMEALDRMIAAAKQAEAARADLLKQSAKGGRADG
jgi:hypothetical protein